MKKCLFYLLGFVLLLGCEKEEIKKKDYTTFLNYSVSSIFGKLNGNNISWGFGYRYQGVSGYQNGSGICDSTDPSRMLLFGLTEDNGGSSYFRIYTPTYDASSNAQVEELFSIGEKRLGEYRSDFHLVLNIGNVLYETADWKQNKIQVLKRIEYVNSNRILTQKVWFALTAKLKPVCGCNKPDMVLTDGLILAEFYGLRF